MLLPLQGESAVVYASPRAPLRSALGYVLVAPSGRTDGIIPPISFLGYVQAALSGRASTSATPARPVI